MHNLVITKSGHVVIIWIRATVRTTVRVTRVQCEHLEAARLPSRPPNPTPPAFAHPPPRLVHLSNHPRLSPHHSHTARALTHVTSPDATPHTEQLIMRLPITLAVLASLSSPIAALYTADVLFINLLHEEMVSAHSIHNVVFGKRTAHPLTLCKQTTPQAFGGCYTNHTGTIQTMPTSIPAQQVTRLFINTTTFAEDVGGYCWWSFKSSSKCDPHAPPKPVKSCPYIGWKRVVVLGQESISWEFETPGHFGAFARRREIHPRPRSRPSARKLERGSCSQTCTHSHTFHNRHRRRFDREGPRTRCEAVLHLPRC